MSEKQEKEWTLMFYFASDNPLAPSVVSQLKALKQSGFHPDANVVVQFDPQTPNTPTHVFDVNLIKKLNRPNQSVSGFIGLNASDPFVTSLMEDKLWNNSETSRDEVTPIRELLIKSLAKKGITYNPPKPLAVNGTPKASPPKPHTATDATDTTDANANANGNGNGNEPDPETALTRFLDFCSENYPARHYMLFLLGHGLVVGNDVFLFDEHAAINSLKLCQLGRLLKKFKTEIKTRNKAAEFELISLNSCSMSAAEVAYELQDTANFMLASQGPAFVGSWPYRQILIRVFNDLNASVSEDDLLDVAGLTNKLQTGTDPLSELLRPQLTATTALLTRFSGPQPDGPTQPLATDLRKALVKDLKRLTGDLKLAEHESLQQLNLSERTQRLKGTKHLNRGDKRRLNRMLLADAFPDEIARTPKTNIQKMLVKIFYYCLYNSSDFILAGYSFDLCLCDLRKITDLEDALQTLVEKLIAGVSMKDSLEQEAILLAHWKSQSYWEEHYTDLFDFCFCLHQRCKALADKSDLLQEIVTACEAVMAKLEKGDDNLIVRSAFAGPAYQYSNGLSVFFPWAKPERTIIDEYGKYAFAKTNWLKFLHAYFEATQRKTRREELKLPEPSAEDMLLEDIASLVYNQEGPLSLENSLAPLPDGKVGSGDRTGDGCMCQSIKNHPHDTRALRDRGRKVSEKGMPFSESFLTQGLFSQLR